MRTITDVAKEYGGVSLKLWIAKGEGDHDSIEVRKLALRRVQLDNEAIALIKKIIEDNEQIPTTL